jgi:hypothetical protein
MSTVIILKFLMIYLPQFSTGVFMENVLVYFNWRWLIGGFGWWIVEILEWITVKFCFIENDFPENLWRIFLNLNLYIQKFGRHIISWINLHHSKFSNLFFRFLEVKFIEKRNKLENWETKIGKVLKNRYLNFL